MNTQLIVAAIRKGARAKTNYTLYKTLIISGIVLAVILLTVVIILLIKMKKSKGSDKAGSMPPPPMPPMPPMPQVPPMQPMSDMVQPQSQMDAIPLIVDTETPPQPIAPEAPVAPVVLVEPEISVAPVAVAHYIMLTNIENFSETYEAKIEDKITIGKKNCDIVIPNDTSISGSHCIIGFADNKYILSDDYSTNGTKYNDVKLTAPVFIEDGGVISIGRGKYRVTMIDKEEQV